VFLVLLLKFTYFLDSYIQKTKKNYMDSRKSNLTRLNTELQEVQKIMVQNIDDVLQRGDALQGNF
jgi:vesicle transport protein SEC22